MPRIYGPSPRFIDLTGKKFGRLTVISRAENTHRPSANWNCVCECGNEKVVNGSELRIGQTRSCGCLIVDVTRKRCTTHGDGARKNKAPEYTSWLGMRSRCLNPNTPKYKYYGGRGITICRRWKDSYENFLSDMGRKPTPKHTIDRIDNDKGYSPNNCRWATQKEQMNNIRHWMKRLQGKKKNCQSKYKGVSRQKGNIKNKLWRAYIEIDGKFKHLGGFNTEKEAARAYDKVAMATFGDNIRLNFPLRQSHE